MRMEPEITSSLASDSETVNIEAPKISLPKVIELDFPMLEKTQIEVIQPKVP